MEPYEIGDGYGHVAFVVDDLEEVVSELKEQGVEVAVEPKTLSVDGNDYKISFVTDPDGYRVELVERGTMKVGDMRQ
jgi:lactoylglutathione lyase